jgi:hypothetical protein
MVSPALPILQQKCRGLLAILHQSMQLLEKPLSSQMFSVLGYFLSLLVVGSPSTNRQAKEKKALSFGYSKSSLCYCMKAIAFTCICYLVCYLKHFSSFKTKNEIIKIISNRPRMKPVREGYSNYLL